MLVWVSSGGEGGMVTNSGPWTIIVMINGIKVAIKYIMTSIVTPLQSLANIEKFTQLSLPYM